MYTQVSMCFCYFRIRDRIKKNHPAQYELGAYKPNMQVEEEDDFYPGDFDSRELGSSQTVLTDTDSQDKGWRKIENVGSVEDFQSTFVNEEAIYVNSTFRGEITLIRGSNVLAP